MIRVSLPPGGPLRDVHVFGLRGMIMMMIVLIVIVLIIIIMILIVVVFIVIVLIVIIMILIVVVLIVCMFMLMRGSFPILMLTVVHDLRLLTMIYGLCRTVNYM